MTSASQSRATKIIGVISQTGVLLLCLSLLKDSLPPVSDNRHYLFVAVLFIIARFALYLQGVAFKNARMKLAFFGTEYCAAGYAMAHLRAPTSFVIFLFVLGLVALLAEYRDSLLADPNTSH